MPAARFESCHPGQWHFDNCPMGNLHRDGPWRFWLSSASCDCPCHKLGLTDEQIAADWRGFWMRVKLLWFAVMGMLILIVWSLP